MHHIFIAPHLDDAVLSCGELIYSFRKRGDSVTVLTVFTQNPEKGEISDTAKSFHSDCFLQENAMTTRKEEDRAAAVFLDYNFIHLDLHECLYRKGQDGKFLYPKTEDICGDIHKADVEVQSKLSDIFPKLLSYADYVYAPLAFGSHVDHQIIKKVVDISAVIPKEKIFYYEDIPYIFEIDANERHKTCESAGLFPLLIHVTEEAWQAKADAILLYRSQLSCMWKNDFERMEQLKTLSLQYTDKPCVRLWSHIDAIPDWS